MKVSVARSTPDAIKTQAHLASFDEASRLIGEHATPLGVERISLDDADGRVLASPAIAQCSSPPVLVSAMDGYAVRDADLAARPVSLRIAGKSFAGADFDGALPLRACVRIFTGAAAPMGTDRIVMQEDVCEKDDLALFMTPLSKSRHLRLPGSDFTKGDIVVPAGRALTPQGLVGIAASDLAHIDVFRRPRVAILCCGDELREPGHAGDTMTTIPESISYGVTALIRQWGGTVVARWRTPDDLHSLQTTAAKACDLADVVVAIGGASVGERDLAKKAFSPQRLMLSFAKVAIKPGKPVWFGRAGRTLVIGLPGNPTSALVTARLFLAPLLAGLSGRRYEDALDWRMMRAEAPLAGCNDRDVFVRAEIAEHGVVPLADQDSASQKTLANATHLIRRRSGASSCNPGKLVETLIL